MARTTHVKSRLGPALAGLITVATVTLAPTDAVADKAVEAPTATTAPGATPGSAAAEDSAPLWMWFIPPVGLILGLTLGARLRSRHSRTQPKT